MNIFKAKSLTDKIKRLESGEEYQRLNEKIDKLSSKTIKLETNNNRLKEKNTKLTVKNKELSFDYKELKKDMSEMKKNFDDLYKHIAKTEEIIKEDRKVIKELKKENKELKAELTEKNNLNKKLTAQVNRDYTNSSLPSSQKIGRKKICNSRTKSGKKVGGQPGHEGHSRQKCSDTDKIKIIKVPRSKKYEDENIFIETGKIIKKQVIDIVVNYETIEYHFAEYKNKITGEKTHESIPKELYNETSYGKNVKALAVLLNSYVNASIDKTSEIIYEISDQNIKLSKGFINKLNSKVIKEKANELDEIFKNLQKYKFMHIDATNVRVNGKNANVFVTANPTDTLFYARENKGKKGVAGTAAEDYVQLLVHDHDKTFYNYGVQHQECIAHILRYLQSATENEPKLTWHIQMKSLLQEMISTVKKGELDIITKEKYIIKYDDLLKLSKEEYDKNPPTKYFREGFNLAKRLREYKESTLYFLEDEEIPYTNNLAERQLRKIKRKSHAVGTFRSYESLEEFCRVQSILENAKTKGASLFRHIANSFPQISFNN